MQRVENGLRSYSCRSILNSIKSKFNDYTDMYWKVSTIKQVSDKESEDSLYDNSCYIYNGMKSFYGFIPGFKGHHNHIRYNLKDCSYCKDYEDYYDE